MDSGNSMSPADYAAISGGGWGGFGNGFEGLIYLAVIASMFGGGWGGFGGWGGNGAAAAMAGNLATQNDLQQAFNYSNLLDGNRDLSNLITNGTAQSVAATNQTFHDTLAALTDKYSELARDVAAVQVGQANALANQNQCCCETRMEIANAAAGINAGVSQARYDNAQNAAAIQAGIAQARYDDAINAAGINANIAQSRYDTQMGVAAINANTTAQIQSIKDMLYEQKEQAQAARIQSLELQQAMNGVLRFPNTWSYGAGQFPPIFGGCCGNGNI